VRDSCQGTNCKGSSRAGAGKMAAGGAPRVCRHREGLRRDKLRVSVEGGVVDGAKDQIGRTRTALAGATQHLRDDERSELRDDIVIKRRRRPGVLVSPPVVVVDFVIVVASTLNIQQGIIKGSLVHRPPPPGDHDGHRPREHKRREQARTEELRCCNRCPFR
jgi:hypothetical protein